MGDFFNYIAMAWLVLSLTGSRLALGAVLMVQAVPRSILMLVGGAIADRLSPRVAMAGSMVLRFVCVAPLAYVVITGHAQIWEAYAVSALFGVFDAFFYPAASSMLPQIVMDSELEAGNAVTNVTRQVSLIVGPAVAGVVVAAFGTGWAFAGDAGFLVAGAAVIAWMPARASVTAAGISEPTKPVMTMPAPIHAQTPMISRPIRSGGFSTPEAAAPAVAPAPHAPSSTPRPTAPAPKRPCASVGRPTCIDPLAEKSTAAMTSSAVLMPTSDQAYRRPAAISACRLVRS